MELIVELLLEGSLEASQSKKVPKPLRYILLGFVLLFFIFIIGAIILLGISVLMKDNVLSGIIVILFGILLAVLSIIRFRKDYIKKKDEINENTK